MASPSAGLTWWYAGAYPTNQGRPADASKVLDVARCNIQDLRCELRDRACAGSFRSWPAVRRGWVVHVLFVHRAFPSQFGQLAVELNRRYGWRCTMLTEEVGSCPSPTPEMWERIEVVPIAAEGRSSATRVTHWMRAHEVAIDLARRVALAVRARPDLRPDLVVGHCGLGPTLFLGDLVDAPIALYCEYYHAARFGDLTYRVDLPAESIAPFYPRSINAVTLQGLIASDLAFSATEAQRRSFPERYRSRLAVQFDGVDTELYRPRRRERVEESGIVIPRDATVVTYVARGLESLRGFDLFLRVAERLQRWRTDLLFVVVGSGWSYYGWDRLSTGSERFMEWAIGRSSVDRSRFLFTGQIVPERLAPLLARSDLHLYLSVPFVASWSFFDAMSSECAIVAGDVEAVREVADDGVQASYGPLYDGEALFEAGRRLLEDREAARSMGAAARRKIEERYSLEITIPAFREMFEGAAASGGWDRVR